MSEMVPVGSDMTSSLNQVKLMRFFCVSLECVRFVEGDTDVESIIAIIATMLSFRFFFILKVYLLTDKESTKTKYTDAQNCVYSKLGIYLDE